MFRLSPWSDRGLALVGNSFVVRHTDVPDTPTELLRLQTVLLGDGTTSGAYCSQSQGGCHGESSP
jgi:hypothetical protein